MHSFQRTTSPWLDDSPAFYQPKGRQRYHWAIQKVREYVIRYVFFDPKSKDAPATYVKSRRHKIKVQRRYVMTNVLIILVSHYCFHSQRVWRNPFLQHTISLTEMTKRLRGQGIDISLRQVQRAFKMLRFDCGFVGARPDPRCDDYNGIDRPWLRWLTLPFLSLILTEGELREAQSNAKEGLEKARAGLIEQESIRQQKNTIEQHTVNQLNHIAQENRRQHTQNRPPPDPDPGHGSFGQLLGQLRKKMTTF